MRNRAKCKLCQEIIESFHRYDCVSCKCGEISVDGGQDYCRCMAGDWANFIRIDNEGNEVIPRIVDEEKALDELVKEGQERGDYETKLTKKDLVDMLKAQAEAIERMPPVALSSYVTNYDLLSLLLVLSGIFADERLDAS